MMCVSSSHMTVGEVNLLPSLSPYCQHFLATLSPHPNEKDHPIRPTRQDCISKPGNIIGIHHKDKLQLKPLLPKPKPTCPAERTPGSHEPNILVPLPLKELFAGTYSTMVVCYLLVSNAVDRVVFGVLGMVVSLYSLRVEVMKERYPNYRAACDFSGRFSCSKALCSPYGKGFGFVGLLVGTDHFLNQRNCTLGILFYTIQISLGLLPVSTLCSCVLFYSSVLASIGCVYLAFILFVVLRDICIVCISTYFINSALVFLSYSLYYKYMSE